MELKDPMDTGVIRQAIDSATERGLTVEEALSHWQLAGGAAAGARAAHWVSIGFGIARAERAAARLAR
jgi:hypothetical protein